MAHGAPFLDGETTWHILSLDLHFEEVGGSNKPTGTNRTVINIGRVVRCQTSTSNTWARWIQQARCCWIHIHMGPNGLSDNYPERVKVTNSLWFVHIFNRASAKLPWMTGWSWPLTELVEPQQCYYYYCFIITVTTVVEFSRSEAPQTFSDDTNPNPWGEYFNSARAVP